MREYVLADGTALTMDTTVAQIEFEGKTVGGTVIFIELIGIDRKSNREPNECGAPRAASGWLTDQHDGEAVG